MPAALAIPLAIQGIKSIYGLWQSNNAQKKLDELENQPLPKYLTGQEIYDQANQKATGLSFGELANAHNNLNVLNNTRYQYAKDRNPSFSNAIQSAVNYGSIQGTLGIEAQNQIAIRSSLNQLIGLIGGQSNRQVGSDLQRRQQQELALGQQGQTGVRNIFTGLEGAGSMIYNNSQQNEYLKFLTEQFGNKATASTTPNYLGGTTNMTGAPVIPSFAEFKKKNIDPYSQPPDFAPYNTAWTPQ